MESDIRKAMRDISLRMRLLKAVQEEQQFAEALTERETLILELLKEHGPMTVSQLAAADPDASDSTISMTVTKLWRDKKLLTKTINPNNQRTTVVGLTEKGMDIIDALNDQRERRMGALLEAIAVTPAEEEVLLNILNRAVEFFDTHHAIETSK